MTAQGTKGLDAIRERGDTAPETVEDTLRPREQAFLVKYKDPTGVEHEGVLVSRILDNDERMEAARIASRLAGVAWNRLPPSVGARIWALSNMAIQLRDTPSWAKKWLPEDDVFLFSVWSQCELHELEFFRSGGREGSEGKETPRVSITPVVASANAEE